MSVGQAAAEQPGLDERFGAVLFDDPDDLNGGYYWLGREVKRFRRCGEIPVGSAETHEGGHIYLTNMGTRLLDDLGGRRAHFRGDGFLRARLHFMFEEFGIQCRKRLRSSEPGGESYIIEPVSNRQRPMAVRLMAMVFQRVMRMARLDDIPPAYGLWYLLRDRADFPPPDAAPAAASGFAKVLRLAGKERETYGTTPRRGHLSREFPVIRLQRNRLWHARDVAGVAVPSGEPEWRYVRESSRAVDWVLRSQQPVLAEARVVKQPAEYEAPVNIGGGSRRERQYFTQPELFWLVRLGFEIEVLGAYVGAGYEEARIPLPQGALAEMSWSAGLYAENLWKARSLQSRRGMRGSTGGLSAAGLWLHAQDRIVSFLFGLNALGALRAHPELFETQLVGYGMGHARLQLPVRELSESAREQIAETARLLGAAAVGLDGGTQFTVDE